MHNILQQIIIIASEYVYSRVPNIFDTYARYRQGIFADTSEYVQKKKRVEKYLEIITPVFHGHTEYLVFGSAALYRILNTEGLRQQIQNNLRLELVLEDDIQQQIVQLTQNEHTLEIVAPAFLQWKNAGFSNKEQYSEEFMNLLDTVGLSIEALAQVYYIQSALRSAYTEKNYILAEWCIAERAQLFGVVKTKVAKRLRNLELLNSLVA